MFVNRWAEAHILFKKHRSFSIFSSNENGLEVNANKTKNMVMSRDQNAERSHNVKIGNSSFEWGGRVQIFGNNLNESKFYSGRNLRPD